MVNRLILATLCILLVVGCTPNTGSGTVSEIVIGYVYPLTGSQATTGADLKQGLELAQEIINGEYEELADLPLAKTAGLPNLRGAKIKLVAADHAGDAERGTTETVRLIEQEKVVAIIGAYNSAVTQPASQAAEAAGIPFVNPDSTAQILTGRGFRWFFRTTADDAIFVQNFYDFLADVRDRAPAGTAAPTGLAVVYENSLFGTGVGQLEIAGAAQAGLTVVSDMPYSSKAETVDEEVRRIAGSRAQLVMQTSYEQDAILFMQAYKAQGYRPEAILAMDAGFISPAFVTALGDDANYVLSRDVWSADLAQAKPIIGLVNDLYRQKYGANLTGNSSRAFTALMVLADAINRAGSTEPAKIRQALLDTNMPPEQLIMPWDGVKFDPATGQNTLARGIIVQIQDQTYHTVWPWDLATVDLVWPMPPWGQ